MWAALTDPDLTKQYMAGAHVKTDWQEGNPITFEGEWEGTSLQDKGAILEVTVQVALSGVLDWGVTPV